MDPERTKSHAAHEDPTHFAAVLFVMIASREPRGVGRLLKPDLGHVSGVGLIAGL
jgi:hypothetical protein